MVPISTVAPIMRAYASIPALIADTAAPVNVETVGLVVDAVTLTGLADVDGDRVGGVIVPLRELVEEDTEVEDLVTVTDTGATIVEELVQPAVTVTVTTETEAVVDAVVDTVVEMTVGDEVGVPRPPETEGNATDGPPTAEQTALPALGELWIQRAPFRGSLRLSAQLPGPRIVPEQRRMIGPATQ